MAVSVSVSSKSIFYLFVFLFGCCSLNVIEAGFGIGGGGGRGTRVGGKTEIKDVKDNKEVQELGKYCVEKYNLKPKNQIGTLKFVEVVKAEKQVVSGIEYYLKISATAAATADLAAAKKGGQEKMFDAVVVVKAWIPSKELVEFSPSTNN